MSAQRPLDGRVAVVTGSRRGIGRAMVLHLAREGASVVVTGKSETGSDKLPGSIHTVAAEVEAAGGSALAVRVDVRHEDEVKAMVDATVERFGRLDILINNAGALWWRPVLETPPKRYDLMWEINVAPRISALTMRSRTWWPTAGGTSSTARRRSPPHQVPGMSPT